jgi:hypothetical protein
MGDMLSSDHTEIEEELSGTSIAKKDHLSGDDEF